MGFFSRERALNGSHKMLPRHRLPLFLYANFLKHLTILVYNGECVSVCAKIHAWRRQTRINKTTMALRVWESRILRAVHVNGVQIGIQRTQARRSVGPWSALDLLIPVARQPSTHEHGEQVACLPYSCTPAHRALSVYFHINAVGFAWRSWLRVCEDKKVHKLNMCQVE